MLAARDQEHGKKRPRDPGRTRQHLLQAAFREVYKHGFQSAGIDAILAATNVTKGALYHHFESKEALGYAVVEEIVAKLTRERWTLPLQRSEGSDPIDALIGIVQGLPHRPRDVKRGCPLANLAQEMSQLDGQFGKRLERIFHAWQECIALALRRGQSLGTVRRDLVPEESASFLIAMVEGYAVLAKNAQDAKVWNAGVGNIVGWLKSLRPPDRIMKRRTKNDRDRSVAQESAGTGSLRAGGRGGAAGTGKGRHAGRESHEQRADYP